MLEYIKEVKWQNQKEKLSEKANSQKEKEAQEEEHYIINLTFSFLRLYLS